MAASTAAHYSWLTTEVTAESLTEARRIIFMKYTMYEHYWSQQFAARPVASHVHRRHLLGLFDNETFRWAVIAIGVVIALCVLALTIWAIVTKCGRGKSAAVNPEKEGDVEQNSRQNSRAIPAKDAKGAPPGLTPVPPWTSDPSRLPPGIVLTPVTPPTYDVKMRPRQATDPPYERLALVSSRVHNAEEVAKSLLPNVAYVVYDWKNFTLQELLRYIKKVLDTQKVASIAVIAPGSKPGSVGLLEGSGTSAEKLSSKTEVSQFWRALAGCLQPQPQAAASAAGGAKGVSSGAASKGHRIDLLGCRVAEAPEEGAALLKELSDLTAVPVAAADDAQGGYKLSTYAEDPKTKQLGLAPLDILAMDLYFNRAALLGVPVPGGAAAAAAPAAATMTRSAPPPTAVGMASAGAAGAAAAATATGAASGQPEVASRASPPRAIADTAVSAGAPAATPPTAATAPLAAAAPVAAAVPVAAAAAPVATAAAGTAAGVGSDIFTRLDAALKARGRTPEAVFDLHDRDGNGQLSTAELTELMRAYVPDATPMDIKHLQAMLETDVIPNEQQELLLRRQEFVDGIPQNVEIQRDVREGRDKDEVIERLREYLKGNEKELRPLYRKYDANGNGELDHTELRDLVADIPNLEPQEQKFALAYLYHYDQNRDLQISFDELIRALDSFPNKALPGTTVASPPGQQAGLAAASVAAAEGAAQPVANQAGCAEEATRAAPASAGPAAAAAAAGSTEKTDEALPAPADDAAEAAHQSAQQQAATETAPDLPPPRKPGGLMLAPLGSSPAGGLEPLADPFRRGSPFGGGRGAPFSRTLSR